MGHNTKKICLLAILMGLISVSKLAIPIPNVEVVTSLFVSFSIVLSLREILAISFCFVLLEIFIWGFALWWVLTYFIYWPTMCLTVSLVSKIKPKKFLTKNKFYGQLNLQLPPKTIFFDACVAKGIVVGIVFTIIFGFLSTLVEIIVFRGFGSNFFVYYYLRYIFGLPFFVTNIVSNAIALPIIVPILVSRLQKIGYTLIQ